MLARPNTFAPRDLYDRWTLLPPGQRLLLIGVAGAALLVLAFFVNLARTPDYAVAFSNLRDADAAAIVAKLKESKIPYEVAERGTIKVPSAQVQEVRLLMAAQGLPQTGGSVGFELFNQPHLGLTEFSEKVNYQRALEGELSRTISRLDAVESARVHLVVPQPSVFAANQKEPTASVVLTLKPGRRLDAVQVQGITHLVAGSVEGLKPQNVTVMDATGAILSDGRAEGDPGRLTGTRADVQRALETRLEGDIVRMLGRVLGPEKVLVRVNADLDWDQYESNSETFSPNERPAQIRSQRELVESQTQGAERVGGAPGADSNVPTYPGAAGDTTGPTTAQRREMQTNYELSKTVERLVRAPGSIKRLSVAVALDSAALADPDQADAISRLVATAAGLDVSRGDVVTLTSLPFSPAAERPAAAENTREREFVITVARLVAMILGPLLVVGLIGLMLGRSRSSTRPSITVSTPPVPALPGATPPLEARPAAPAFLPLTAEAQEEQRLTKELAGMVRADPAAVAQLVRTWMHEDTQPR